MKYKVKYQIDQKLKMIILEANSFEVLEKREDFPSNVISIKEIRSFSWEFNLFKNTKKDVLEFFTQLDIMLNAHLTFSESLDLLADSDQEKKIKEIIKVMQQSISSSHSISESLFKYTDYLGETSLLFLKLGFQNGNIKESVHSLVEILEEDLNSKDKLHEVMRYPLILVVSLFLSIGMIFFYVLPNFEFIFTLLKDEMPFSTYLLLTLKEILYKYWFVLSILCIGLFLSVLFFIKKYRYNYDEILLMKIPLFSKMMQSYYFYRLFLSLSIIVKSKYQFQVAIKNSKNIINNLYAQKVIEKISMNIQNGVPISEAFGKSGLFDSLTMKLLKTAENTNNYEAILLDITLKHKKQFHKSLKNFSSTIEPMLVFIISLVVLWLILAIMLPIWNLGTVMN